MSDRRAMVLGDILFPHELPNVPYWGWYAPFGEIGGKCPTPHCKGLERHFGPCTDASSHRRVERIYKGDIRGREVWTGKEWMDVNEPASWNLEIHEGEGAYERAYADAMTTGKGFARLTFSGDFKSIYGSAAADTLTQEAQSNGEYALGPDPVGDDYHYTAKFGWQPKQRYWSCKHFPSAIDNWGYGRKPEYCLVCHPVPDTFVSVDSKTDRYTCARCGAQYSEHLTQVDAQEAARAGGMELGIINGEDRFERCPVEAPKEPRTFVSAGNPDSPYLCKCGDWYHNHKITGCSRPWRSDGTDPYAACPVTRKARTFVSAGYPSSGYLCKCGNWYHEHKHIAPDSEGLRDDGTDPCAACP